MQSLAWLNANISDSSPEWRLSGTQPSAGKQSSCRGCGVSSFSSRKPTLCHGGQMFWTYPQQPEHTCMLTLACVTCFHSSMALHYQLHDRVPWLYFVTQDQLSQPQCPVAVSQVAQRTHETTGHSEDGAVPTSEFRGGFLSSLKAHRLADPEGRPSCQKLRPICSAHTKPDTISRVW